MVLLLSAIKPKEAILRPNSHLWCLGTMSPLALMLALCGRHGMSLERCLVRNMPQREQRCSVASVWKISLSGWGNIFK